MSLLVVPQHSTTRNNKIPRSHPRTISSQYMVINLKTASSAMRLASMPPGQGDDAGMTIERHCSRFQPVAPLPHVLFRLQGLPATELYSP